MEAQHVIWFQLAQRFQEMSSENVDADIEVNADADDKPLPIL